MNIKFSVLFIVSQLVLGSVGQIMLDATDADYMQDFDGLSASAGSHAWAQDSTLSSWYAFKQGVAATTYTSGNGNTGTDNLYSYGPSSGSTSDRALGVQLAGGAGEFILALHLKNADNVKHITQLTVQYTGEQWRKGTEPAHPLSFYYAIDLSSASDISTYHDAWTSFETLDFTGPDSPATAAATDGNTKHTIFNSDNSYSVDIPPNTEFWLIWAKQAANPGKTSFGLAVDDLTVTATFTTETPETGLMVDAFSPGDSDTYSQNFDNLPDNGGQYYFFDGFHSGSFELAAWETDVSINPVFIYQYQPTTIGYHLFPVFSYLDDGDYALGFYPNTPERIVTAGFSIKNNEATKKIASFVFDATLSQQYCGGVDTTTLKAYYSVDAESLDDPEATWVQIGTTFTSLADCDGNTWLTADASTGKHKQDISSTVNLKDLATEVDVGNYIYFSFVAETSDTTTTTTSGFNGVAIDDLNIVFAWDDGTTSTGSSGDPHFYGFLGQKYDVMGQSYEVYNVITSPYLQINSRFTPYYKTATQVTPTGKMKVSVNCHQPTGTMMGELGIKFHSHSIYANSNSSFVELDGQDVKIDQEWTLTYPGGIVVTNAPVPGRTTYTLTIETPDIVISFIRKAYYVNGLEPQWHYDYKTRVLAINDEFHGLLGQTWDNKVFHNKEGAFKYLDGNEEDYRIRSSRIFGDDFKFNKFQQM